MKKYLFAVVLLMSSFQGVAKESVTLGVSLNILSLPVVVAHEQAFFKKHNVKVEVHDCPTGAKCLASMLDGKVDMATATELPVVLAGFKRQDFSIVATFATTTNDLKILAHAKANIKSPLDLQGKRVAFVPGTASQYFLDTVLIYNGVDPRWVTRQAMPVDEAVREMVEGNLDAVCLWEPYISIIREKASSKVSLVPVPRLYIETFNLIANETMIKHRPKDIQRILMAIKESIAFIENNPKASAALLEKRLNVPRHLIEAVLDDYRFKLSLAKSLPRTMDGQARWAIRAGHAPAQATQPNTLDLLDPTFLLAVDPQAVTVP